MSGLPKSLRLAGFVLLVCQPPFVKLDVDRPIEVFLPLELLQEYGVLVVPGNRFDKESHVRIGCIVAIRKFFKGLGKTVAIS